MRCPTLSVMNTLQILLWRDLNLRRSSASSTLYHTHAQTFHIITRFVRSLILYYARQVTILTLIKCQAKECQTKCLNVS